MNGFGRIRARKTTRSVVGSERDLRVLGSLSWAGYLSTAQAALLHFPSRRTAQRRLRALLDHGLVRAHLQGTALHLDNIYTLAPSGVARLESDGTRGARSTRAPRPQKLAHGLAIRDVFVGCLLAETDGLFGVEDFRFDGDLHDEPIFKAAGIVPDALVTVKRDGRTSTVGFEVDLGTETTRALRKKLASWRELLAARVLGETSLVFLVNREGRLSSVEQLATDEQCRVHTVLLSEFAKGRGCAWARLFAPGVRAARIGAPEEGERFQVVSEPSETAFRIVSNE